MSSLIIPSSNQTASNASKTRFLKHKHFNYKIIVQIVGIVLMGLTAISFSIAGLILGSWAITAPGIALVICLMGILIVSHLQSYKKKTSKIDHVLSSPLEVRSFRKSLDSINQKSNPIGTSTDTISPSLAFDPNSIELMNSNIKPAYRIFANHDLANLQATLYENWGMEACGDYFITLRNLKNGIRLTVPQALYQKKPFDTSFIDNVSPNNNFEKGCICEVLSDRATPSSPFRLSNEPVINNDASLSSPGLSSLLNIKECLSLIKERFSLTFQKMEENNFSHVQMPLINRDLFTTDRSEDLCSWMSACYNLFLDAISNLSSKSSIKHIILIDPPHPFNFMELAANFCNKITIHPSNSNKNTPTTKTTYLVLQ